VTWLRGGLAFGGTLAVGTREQAGAAGCAQCRGARHRWPQATRQGPRRMSPPGPFLRRSGGHPATGRDGGGDRTGRTIIFPIETDLKNEAERGGGRIARPRGPGTPASSFGFAKHDRGRGGAGSGGMSHPRDTPASDWNGAEAAQVPADTRRCSTRRRAEGTDPVPSSKVAVLPP